MPFNLTQSRTFDILGWDSWPSAPTPSAIQFRWNAAIGKYEVLAPGYADWSRLEALQDLRFGGTPYDYDVFGSGGTKLPFYMIVLAPPHRSPADGYVGNARIFESSFARAYFAFGIATEPGDVPVSGTMTCSFGEDEIGEGGLTFDLAAGTVSGWAEPFWAECPIPAGSDELRPGRHDLCRHVRDRWGPGRPLLRPTGGQRRGPGKGRRPRLRSREWNHDRGVRGMREHRLVRKSEMCSAGTQKSKSAMTVLPTEVVRGPSPPHSESLSGL